MSRRAVPGLCTVTDPLDAWTATPSSTATRSRRRRSTSPQSLRDYALPVGTRTRSSSIPTGRSRARPTSSSTSRRSSRATARSRAGCAIGYSFNRAGKYELAAIGRNITDEENVKGGIDFNNLTGFDNEPRVHRRILRTLRR